jgi:hypothetical protein
MPVHEVRKNGELIGYKYGSSGKLYTIAKYGRIRAKILAFKQASAIYHSQGRRGKPAEPIS